MGKRMVVSGFEELVLMAVWHLGEDTYGVPIRKRVEEVTGKDVSVGALYTTLERLKEKGYISSREGEPTAERGGRRKRLFKIEGAGLAALDEARRMRESMAGGWVPGFQPVEGMA